jgi:hypothetical protein
MYGSTPYGGVPVPAAPPEEDEDYPEAESDE